MEPYTITNTQNFTRVEIFRDDIHPCRICVRIYENDCLILDERLTAEEIANRMFYDVAQRIKRVKTGDDGGTENEYEYIANPSGRANVKTGECRCTDRGPLFPPEPNAINRDLVAAYRNDRGEVSVIIVKDGNGGDVAFVPAQ